MVAGIVFIVKAVIITDVLTRAMTRWQIFAVPRDWLKEESKFFAALLTCYECSSVWAGTFTILYLMFFEISTISYILIASRLATFLYVLYDYIDAARAVKEGQL